MTTPFTIILPAVTFDLGNYKTPEWTTPGLQSSQDVKQAYDLFEIAPAFDMPAGPIEAIGFNIWQQLPWQAPAGYQGDVLFGLDPGGKYAEAAFYPEREDVAAATWNDLGAVTMAPGMPHGMTKFKFREPWVINPGDLIIVAPQSMPLESWTPVQADFWPRIILTAEGGVPTLKAGIVDHWPLGCGYRNNPVASLRTAVKAIKYGGAEVRVALMAGQFDSTLSRVEIGKQSGTGSSMVSAPIPLLTGGMASVTVPRRTTVWTDWTPFSTTVGDNLLVHVNNTQGARTWRTHSHLESWYSTTASDGMAALQGSPGHQPGFRHSVAAVQVR